MNEYSLENETLEAGEYIRTYGGKYVDVFDAKSEDFSIEAIAHSLSMQCRFMGHINEFYSIAQHSVMVCDLLPDEYKFEGLMHDASEAYLCDIPTPIKPRLSNYYEIEHELMVKLSRRYNFNYPLSKEVKKADYEALQFEWNNLVISKKYIDLGYKILSPKEAKFKFLEYYKKYRP